jgi:hypothetical protein
MSGKRRLCDECVATSDKTGERLWVPVVHRPGQLIWRFHVHHEADCPCVARESSGIMPWPQDPVMCNDCAPTFWWEKLPGNGVRIELYHADDCSARAASELVAAHA